MPIHFVPQMQLWTCLQFWNQLWIHPCHYTSRKWQLSGSQISVDAWRLQLFHQMCKLSSPDCLWQGQQTCRCPRQAREHQRSRSTCSGDMPRHWSAPPRIPSSLATMQKRLLGSRPFTRRSMGCDYGVSTLSCVGFTAGRCRARTWYQL